jgi:hypothetical protein
MYEISIDFEVFKKLTDLRPTEDVTHNDVIRGLLGLPKASAAVKNATNGNKPWVVGGTSFPADTLFMAPYKGTNHTAEIVDGKLETSDGSKFSSPSAAGVHITEGINVNGWRFWRCKLPGSSQYVLMERLRGKAH